MKHIVYIITCTGIGDIILDRMILAKVSSWWSLLPLRPPIQGSLGTPAVTHFRIMTGGQRMMSMQHSCPSLDTSIQELKIEYVATVAGCR